MKSFRYFLLGALLVAFGVSSATDASAQRDPRDKNRGDSTEIRPDSVRPPKDPRDSTFRDGDKKDSTDIRPDSVRPPKDPRDTTFHGGGHKKPHRVLEAIGYFMHNDSCREVLLSKMSPEDAAAAAELMNALKASTEQVKELRAQLRAAHDAGDSAAFRAISDQLKALYRQIGDNHKALGAIFGKYQELIKQVRKECGGRVKGDGGGPRGGGKGDSNDTGEQPAMFIAPNPVTVGGTAVLTLKLEAETNVGVTISNETGTVLTIAPAPLAAGDQQIALDVSALPRGMYLVQVQLGDRIKIIKLMIN
jgi:hypothetical protein